MSHYNPKINALHKLFLISFFIGIFLLGFSTKVSAQTTKIFSTTGNWNTPGNWSPSGVPGPSDIVVINPGANLTIDVAATCDSVFFVSGATSSSIIISGSNSLTVTRNVHFTDLTANNQSQTINVGAGSFSCDSIWFENTSATTRTNRLLISTGTATVNRIYMGATAAAENQLVFSGDGTLKIGGLWTPGTSTFTPSTGIVEYNGALAQSVRGTTYNKLVLSGSTKTLAASTVVNDSLKIAAGCTLNNSASINLTCNSVLYCEGTYQESNTGGTVTLRGLVHITNSGTFISTVNESFTITNSIRNDGTFSSGSGTYTFTTNAQELSGTSTITFTGAVTITGITLTNNISTLTINGNLTGTGTLVNTAGKTLNLLGATLTIASLDASAAGNTVAYNRTNTQTIINTSYRNLSIGGSNIKSVAADLTVNETLTINAGTLAIDRFTINAGGSFATNGVAAGILRIRNVGATPLPTGKTWNFTVNYDSTAAQNVVNGTYLGLNLTGGNRILSASGTIFITGTYTPGAGVLTVTGNTMEFSGSGTQTIPAAQYNNLVSSNVGARTLAASGTILIAGTFTPGANTYTTTGSTINYNSGSAQSIIVFTYNNLAVTDGFTKTMAGSFTVGGNLVLTSGKLSIGANTLTINGTVTATAANSIVGGATSNLTFGGAGAATTFFLDQTTPGTTNNINTFTINRGTTLITMGNDMVVNGSVTLTSGRLSPGANTLTLTGAFSGSTTNSISGNGTTSTVVFSGSGNVNFFMDQTTIGTTNRLGTLTFNRTGNTLTLNNATQVATALNITSGKIVLNKQTLTINGTVATDATNNITAGAGSAIAFAGSGNTNLFLDQTTPGITNRLTTLTINRTGNTVTMGNNFSLARITLTAGKLAIASNTLTIDSTAAFIVGSVMSANNCIVGNGSSNLSITTSDNIAVTNSTFFFDQTTPGTTNALGSLTLNLGGNTRSILLGNSLIVQNSLTLTQGDLALGANSLTVNGTLTSTVLNAISANGSTSTLIFGNSGNVNFAIDQTTANSSRLGTLTFNRTGNTLTLAAPLQIAAALNITAGKITLNKQTLTLNGTITTDATNNITGGPGSFIALGGTGDATLFMDQTTPGTTNRLSTLSINRTGNTLNLGNSFNLARLTLTAGKIAIGSNTLTLDSIASYIFGAALNATNLITANGSSNLSITTSDNNAVTNPNLFFDQTTNGTTNKLANFTVNLGGNTRSLTLGNSLHVQTALSLTRGDLAIGSNTLTINGTFTTDVNNCLIANANSNLVIGGSGALGSNIFLDQTTSGTTNRLASFTLNRASQTITLGNTMQVTGTVNPTAGTIATGGFLTLISNATNTACLTAGTGSYITGNVTVQRFIPSVARRFRFMSATTTSSTLADWKNEFYITGTGGASNGFDATLTNEPTVYSYTESTAGVSNVGWTSASNITNALTVGKGYRVFVRGDRSDPNRLTDANQAQNAVTTDLVGPVNTGTIAMPVSFTNTGNGVNDGWNLLGNPYPCHYNWNAYYDDGSNLTNMDATIYIYDPNTNGYKSYNAASNVGDITAGIIPAGSAFFIRATAASPSMNFVESFKTTTTPVTLFKNSVEGLRIQLTKDSLNSDAAFIKYINQANDEIDAYDIPKLAGSVNITSVTDSGTFLTANCKPASNTDTIPLNINTTASGSYRLDFNYVTEFVGDKSILLYDKFDKKFIDLKKQSEYGFDINTQLNETFGQRFLIIVGLTLEPSTGINELETAKDFIVYPTLATEYVTVSANQGKQLNAVELFDVSGKMIMSQNIGNNSTSELQISISTIPSGIYFVKTNIKGSQSTAVQRFVKP